MKDNTFLESSQDVPGRPSYRSSMDIKRYGESVKMVTEVTRNKSREVFLLFVRAEEHNFNGLSFTLMKGD
jgi:hypothetical protein